MHDGAMSDADITPMRERVIDKASREVALDKAQKAKLGGMADARKAQRATLMAGRPPVQRDGRAGGRPAV